MQFESHATPFAGTPQQRYATLHRSIESGLDSDEVWRDLAAVSLELGHHGEAVRCARRIKNAADRRAIEYRLQRLGILPSSDAADGGDEPAAAHPANARPHELPGLVEHLLDAVQYLMHQQMPWFVLTTTLAFPLIVGVGGFLTAGGSLLLLAAIAALPGLCVLAVVAAMGRQILLKSSAGESDVPSLPEFGRLLGEARRFAAAALLIGAVSFAPAIAALALGAPWLALALTAAGVYVTPMAFALHQVRGDLQALRPATVLRAAARCGRAYPVLALVTVLMFAPAFGIGWAAIDRPVWVQVAIVGPLCVVPVFAAARLLGAWLDTRREVLGELLRATAKAPAPTAAGEARRDPKRAQQPKGTARPKFPRRPAALENFRAPIGKPIRAASLATPTAAAAAPTAATNTAANPAARPPARAIEGRRPNTRRPAAPAEKPPRTSEAAPAAGAGNGASPAATAPPPKRRRPGLTDSPDLASMPGATVVSGLDRVRSGAASRRP